MKIEAGRFYRTRDGRKVGPIRRDGDGWIGLIPYADRNNASYTCPWAANGMFNELAGLHQLDLIAPCPDEPASPVRTVTRKEIVPGKYGDITITRVGATYVTLELGWPNLTAEALRAAIPIFTQLADALDEQGGAS